MANQKSNTNTAIINLSVQYRDTKQAFTQMNSIMNNLLDGQGVMGRKAYALAYDFSIACMDNPTDAAKLDGWNEAAIKSGANPFTQPIKMLVDDLNPAIQSKMSMLAKVFQTAHNAGIPADKFESHMKRNHGLRKWYDAINLAAKAGNNNYRPTKPAASGVTTKLKIPIPSPVNVVKQVKAANIITYAVIDSDLLRSNSHAMDSLKSNPAFITIADVANDDCRTFLNDNDPRFTVKGGA